MGKIVNRQQDEIKAIDALKLKFSAGKTPIDPGKTAEIIDLWQIKTEYKKDMIDNMPEVDEFIKNAYEEAKRLVDRAVRHNPREAKQSIEEYEQNLLEAIETDLATEPSHIMRQVYTLAAGEPMRQALLQAKRDMKEECLIEANVMLQKACQKVKEGEGEAIEVYINKVSEKVMGNCEKVKQSTSRDEYMTKAANGVLVNFEIDQRSIHAYKTVSKQMEKVFKDLKFTPGEQEAFRIAFPREVGRLSKFEQSSSYNVLKVANNIIDRIHTKKYQKAELSEKRTSELKGWLKDVIIKGFLETLDDDSLVSYYKEKKININPPVTKLGLDITSYYREQSNNKPDERVDLQTIIERAYIPFVADNTELNRYIAGEKGAAPDKTKMESDFKKYLQEINAFRQMANSVTKDGDERAQKFLGKLVTFFGIVPEVAKTMVYEDKKPSSVSAPQPSMTDNMLKYLAEHPPEQIELQKETEGWEQRI